MKHYQKPELHKLQQRALELADDMAASACSLNALTYKNLLESREELKKVLYEFTDTKYE